MFTGLIKEIGTILNIEGNSSGKIFKICSNHIIKEINIGDSIAINGVCLTATEVQSNSFTAQAVHVTLQKTNLGQLYIGNNVNMELALKASDRLGGHIVQGHVNGIGQIVSIKRLGENYEISMAISKDLICYVIREGSIAIDGISLTVAQITDNVIMVSIIPHTWMHTTLHTKVVGNIINIEVDVIAKYVENFSKHYKKEPISLAWLKSCGF